MVEDEPLPAGCLRGAGEEAAGEPREDGGRLPLPATAAEEGEGGCSTKKEEGASAEAAEHGEERGGRGGVRREVERRGRAGRGRRATGGSRRAGRRRREGEGSRRGRGRGAR